MRSASALPEKNANFSFFLLLLVDQASTIHNENALAYGILIAVAVIFPVMGAVYLRSVTTMNAVITAYAGDMLVKSAELTFEKKRTDNLLVQMLPPAVASALTNNQPVPTESFESVSVYFSDIVDFESLVGCYEPLEVINPHTFNTSPWRLALKIFPITNNYINFMFFQTWTLHSPHSPFELAITNQLQVIDLLNTLYTEFDTEIDHFDAYKVETIGI